MQPVGFVKILISLPQPLKQYLNDLRRLEGVTTAGYIRAQLEADLEARRSMGWSRKTGWPQPDTPAYHGRPRAIDVVVEAQGLKAASRIQATRATMAKGRRKGKEGDRRPSPNSNPDLETTHPRSSSLPHIVGRPSSTLPTRSNDKPKLRRGS